MFRQTKKKKISYDKLICLLDSAIQEGIDERQDKDSKYLKIKDANNFLERKGLKNYIFFDTQKKKKSRKILRSIAWYTDEYDPYTINDAHPGRQTLIIQNVDIDFEKEMMSLDGPFWGNVPTGMPVYNCYFKNCRFEACNLPYSISFGGDASFIFYKNEFVWNDDYFNYMGLPSFHCGLSFNEGAFVRFRQNKIKGLLDIRIVERQSDEIKILYSSRGKKAIFEEDDDYHEHLFRREHNLGKGGKLQILSSKNSVMKSQGLAKIEFWGNKDLSVTLWCRSESYIFRDGNKMDLSDLSSIADDKHSEIYIGRREKLYSSDSFETRSMLVALRNRANTNKDFGQVNILSNHITRIEHQIAKEGIWYKNLVDRFVGFCQKWSSDYYTSLIRPVFVGLGGYLLLSFLPSFWVEKFSADFYPSGIGFLLDIELNEDRLQASEKTLLNVVRLLKTFWGGIMFYAFTKTLKRYSQK